MDRFNIWYLLVGIAFIIAGIYRIVSGNLTSGLIWIVIGILFGILSRYSNKQEENKGKRKK